MSTTRAFELFLEQSKTHEERKSVTNRESLKKTLNVFYLLTITNAERKGEITRDPALNFLALVLFGAYTAQRIIATMKRLKVGQSKGALGMEKPEWRFYQER